MRKTVKGGDTRREERKWLSMKDLEMELTEGGFGGSKDNMVDAFSRRLQLVTVHKCQTRN